MILPEDVKFILNELEKNGYEGLVVGGAVRDSIINSKYGTDYEIKDWDFATNAPYKKLKEIFADYNPEEVGVSFGVLLIKINGIAYEIAQYRVESNYKDGRHPDNVKFIKHFYDDAKRRDLTINSIGYNGIGNVDYFDGIKDIDDKIIRFVGNSIDRIEDDKLRMLRCIRFANRLNFELDTESEESIIAMASKINEISKERIKDELNKILLSDTPSNGIRLLYKYNLLKYILPELHSCYGYNQNNSHHDKDLFEHIMTVLDNTKPILINRLSALFHDIAKIQCHSLDEKGESHYYLHHKESADTAEVIMKRLKYDNKTTEIVKKLIYDHMGKQNKLTPKATKRFINRIGVENLDNMFDLLRADIIGHSKPHNFETLDKLIESCNKIINEKQPINKNQLCIDGDIIMKELNLKPSKKIGELLELCMDKVLENSKYNDREFLLTYAKNILNS